MKLEILERIDGGAHADVYKVRNEVGKEYASKLVRPSVGNSDFVLNQATALARVKSPHVVDVIGVETITHPSSGDSCSAIVMELVTGSRLDEYLLGRNTSKEDALRLGTQLYHGLKAIHDAGVIHGDLHAGNVLVSNDNVKIIDILYYTTLAGASTDTQSQRKDADVFLFRSLLRKLLEKSGANFNRSEQFIEATEKLKDLTDIFNLFTSHLLPSEVYTPADLVRFLGRLRDGSYVAGATYASALVEAIPKPALAPLLLSAMEGKVIDQKHRDFCALSWTHLNSSERTQIMAALGEDLDGELPKGNWVSSLRMLQNLGIDAYQMLPALSRIRLEHVIAVDVLTGRYSMSGINLNDSGFLGTWARVFVRAFQDASPLINNLCTLLKGTWDQQNYVGHYFLDVLPRICRSEDQRNQLIEAIAVALNSNAHAVVARLHVLPSDWQQAVSRLRQPAFEDENANSPKVTDADGYIRFLR